TEQAPTPANLPPISSSDASSALIHVIAVQLRLSDLEFNDTPLMTWRNQIRELGYQIQALEQEYRKRQRQKAVAEAQVAWRSTWTAD
ncbi:MAG: hypothetical protein VKJ24_20420, partial [Synechococcales bacterium]|nr:hypothetical protein [Synechococcales bacterium]